jgi:hypothetical protein
MSLPDAPNAPSPPDDDDPLKGSNLRTPVGDRRTPESEQASSPASTAAPLQERHAVEELILIGRHAAAPIPEASFSAAGCTGMNPPDVGGAAGPNHLVAVRNNVLPAQASPPFEDTDTTTGHAQTFYACPSLAVTVLHIVRIGFATFSAQTYPGASWAFRWGSDPQLHSPAPPRGRRQEAPAVGRSARSWAKDESTVRSAALQRAVQW